MEDIKALWNSIKAGKCNQDASQWLQVPGYLQHSAYRCLQRDHGFERMYSLPFLFIFGIDWVLKQVTCGGRRGIRRTLTSVLEDLDYADDIALFAHVHQGMQANTSALATTAGNLGLKINVKKTRHLRMSGRTNESIMVSGEVVDEVYHFTYLGSKVSTSRDGGEEILVPISQASQAFPSLQGIWRSKNISQKTKIQFFKSNVLSTLLYGAESWKMTKTISHKLEVFQNKCLRRNRTNHTASPVKEMEMDWSCAAHATSSTTTNCPQVDP